MRSTSIQTTRCENKFIESTVLWYPLNKKTAEGRNYLLRRKLKCGRVLCGAQIRNVRSVLGRAFLPTKLQMGRNEVSIPLHA